MKTLGICKPPSLVTIRTLIRCHDFDVAPGAMSIGEVYTDEIVKDNLPALSNFFQLLTDNGYARRDSRRYHGLSVTSCKGSVNPHDDPGLGLTALWLVHRKPLFRRQQGWSGEPPLLYGSRQWLRLKLGAIVVFDANKEHAWLSNYHCFMIMQTVKKARGTLNVKAS
jgi:hypothetical protein